MTNNAAERALRCTAVGRNNWAFAGSDAGGRRAARTAARKDGDSGQGVIRSRMKTRYA